MDLLFVFAFPVATIFLSIVLKNILKNIVLVLMTFFSVYLVLAFSVFDIYFIVYTLLYCFLSGLVCVFYDIFFKNEKNIENIISEKMDKNGVNIKDSKENFCDVNMRCLNNKYKY